MDEIILVVQIYYYNWVVLCCNLEHETDRTDFKLIGQQGKEIFIKTIVATVLIYICNNRNTHGQQS